MLNNFWKLHSKKIRIKFAHGQLNNLFQINLPMWKSFWKRNKNFDYHIKVEIKLSAFSSLKKYFRFYRYNLKFWIFTNKKWNRHSSFLYFHLIMHYEILSKYNLTSNVDYYLLLLNYNLMCTNTSFKMKKNVKINFEHLKYKIGYWPFFPNLNLSK